MLGGGVTLAGWQQVFLLVGVPGLLLAPLALRLLPESRTGTVISAISGAPPLMPWLRANRRFLIGHFLGFSLVTIVYNGFLTWEAEFLLRNFGMPKSTGGLLMGGIILLFGTTGLLVGGPFPARPRGPGRAPGARTGWPSARHRWAT